MDCEGNINLFCFVCGKLRFTKRKYWTEKVEEMYKLCFDWEITQNISPDDICKPCYGRLKNFEKGEPMPFKKPMKWLAHEHDNANCYACANKKAKFAQQKLRHVFNYVAVASVEMPIYDLEVMRQSPDPSTSSSTQ